MCHHHNAAAVKLSSGGIRIPSCWERRFNLPAPNSSKFSVRISVVPSLGGEALHKMVALKQGCQPTACEAKSSGPQTDLNGLSFDSLLICHGIVLNLNNVLVCKSRGWLRVKASEFTEPFS